MRRAASAARLAVWSAFLVVTLRLLHGSTMGALSVPLDSTEALAAWADRTAPTVMALGLVRLAALVAAWYLAAATVLTAVADAAGWRPLTALATAVSPALVRQLATRGAGAGLAAGALLGVTPLPTPLDTHPTGLPSADRAPTALATTPVTSTSPLAPRSLPARPHNDDPATATATMHRLPAEATPSMSHLGATTPGRAAIDGPTATMRRLPPPAAPLDPAPAPTATMRRLLSTPSTSHLGATTPAGPDTPTATMRRVPAPAAGDDGSTPPAGSGEPTARGITGNAARPDPRPGPVDPRPEPGPSPDRPTATMTQLPAPAPPPGPSAGAGAGEAAGPGGTATTPPGPAPATVPVAARQAAPEGDEWVIEPGDSFWSIAEETLAEATPHAPPTDAAITAYWRRIVDANRSRLADPSNPDLLLPGQTILVPPATS